jgi:hypothetical protein
MVAFANKSTARDGVLISGLPERIVAKSETAPLGGLSRLAGNPETSSSFIFHGNMSPLHTGNNSRHSGSPLVSIQRSHAILRIAQKPAHARCQFLVCRRYGRLGHPRLLLLA